MTVFLWGALTGACFVSAVYAAGLICVGAFLLIRWAYARTLGR